ncbi:MAG TPA: hypothetical protein ENJ09_12485 [Planctomycetes bacterium]|nr:hypothetical protein [Planctomycetota bacterium]
MTEGEHGLVLLRARSGAEVGMGHVMRSRAVGRELARLGARVLFVVDDSRTATAFSDEPFEVRLASDGWPDGPIRSAWLDGFLGWEEELERLGRRGVPAFLVENRIADRDRAERIVYPALHFVPDAWDSEHSDRVLAGAPWVPLAEDVLRTEPDRSRDIALLVTFGGSDPNGLTERVLPLLDFVPGDLAIGVGHHMAGRRDRIRALAKDLEDRMSPERRVHVLDPGTRLAPWMARSRTALTALGTTLYELAYLEVPALILANYDDDRPALDWYRTHGPHLPIGVHDALVGLELAAELRNRWSELTGRGARRPAGLGGGAVRIAHTLLAA